MAELMVSLFVCRRLETHQNLIIFNGVDKVITGEFSRGSALRVEELLQL
jgi:hypothetical protein